MLFRPNFLIFKCENNQIFSLSKNGYQQQQEIASLSRRFPCCLLLCPWAPPPFPWPLERKQARREQRRHSELAYLFTSVASLEIQENEELLVYILKAFTLNRNIQNSHLILKCRVKWQQWFCEFLCIFMCTFALPESLQVFNTLMMFPIFSSLFYGL